MLGNFGGFSFFRSWKLSLFLTTLISATSFKIWTFRAFLYISETTRTNFFKICSHNLHNVYLIMSESFIKIDSLQHLKISRQTDPRTGQKSALQHSLFWRYANFSKLMQRNIYQWLVHFSVSIVNVLHSKDAMNSNYNIAHGGMYSAHYFVISILKTIFSQISIDSQLLVKILKRYRTRKKHF